MFMQPQLIAGGRTAFRHRLPFILVFCFLLFALTAPAAQTDFVTLDNQRVHPTRILAKLRAGASVQTRQGVFNQHALKIHRAPALVPRLMVLDEDDKHPGHAANAADPGGRAGRLRDRLAALRASGLFEYVEPDHVISLSATPTDTRFIDGTLWGLRNTGQSNGVPGADIGAVGAWDITTGSTNVIVAVLDTGIDYRHKDLTNNLWRNPGESGGGRETNGVDDDLDGYVDNVYGINAVTGSGDPADDNNHGSHVAGTIGASANDLGGHVGVAWNVRLMACKAFNQQGIGFGSDILRGIEFAIANGARIINASVGGPTFSQAAFDTIALARDRGVLLVAAAGNNGSLNNDTTPRYPSSYKLENIISVAALDRNDALPAFSHYGVQSVHVGAPGKDILSCNRTGSYIFMDGTSMAAPHVSGVAALICARYPNVALAELRSRILNTTVPVSDLQGRTLTGGRVNAFNALNAAADGVLDITMMPASNSILHAGSVVTLLARVTDLDDVTNAMVTAVVPGVGSLTFKNDGVFPDIVANDVTSSATLNVPLTPGILEVWVSASAPGKVGATQLFRYEIHSAPVNDDFADATELLGLGVFHGSNRGATKEPGEPHHAASSGGSSTWWKWTALTNEYVTLTTIGSSFDTVLGVYTGASVSNLVLVASNDKGECDGGGSTVSFLAVTGTTYHIAVDGYFGAAGSIRLVFVPSNPPGTPPNDAFTNRTFLTGSNFIVLAANMGASLEPNEPNHTSYVDGSTIWWSWTAPAKGLARFSLDGSCYVRLLAAYTNTALTTLGKVGSGLDQIEFDVLPGQVFQIVVAGEHGDPGTALLSLNLFSPPANDDFANRLPLMGTDVVVTNSNLAATREAVEPRIYTPSGGLYVTGDHTVWWTWTAPTNGRASLTLSNDTFEVVFGVFTGTTVSNLTRVASPINVTKTASAMWDAIAGVTYQIVVDSLRANAGDYQMRLRLIPAAANDYFADRFLLVGTNVVVTNSNLAATREPDEPGIRSPSGGQYNSGDHTVWWTWIAPTDGRASLAVSNDTFDAVFGVFTGNTVSNLTWVTSPSNLLQKIVSAEWDAFADVTYQIAIDSLNAASGDYELSLLFAPASPPANDNFAARLPLDGTNVVVTGSNIGASKEGDEPNPGDNTNATRTLWWRWTAPANGRLTLTHSGNSPKMLAIYTNATLATLGQVAADGDSSSESVNAFTMNVRGGVEYQIQSAARGSNFGNLQLALSFTAAVLNDLFADRIALFGLANLVNAANTSATNEPGEPSHFPIPLPARRSVWWSWTASSNGLTTVIVTSPDFNTWFRIYTGAVVSALTSITNRPPARTNVATFQAIANVEYQIAVDALAYGEFQLSLLAYGASIFTPSPRPASNTLTLNWLGTVGYNYRVEETTNFQNWTSLTNISNTSGFLRYDAPSVTNRPRRFYRATSP